VKIFRIDFLKVGGFLMLAILVVLIGGRADFLASESLKKN
jgi:hypothetical protein